MRDSRNFFWVLGLLAMAAGLVLAGAWAPAFSAGRSDDQRDRIERRVEVIVVDEDGQRHENVYVFGDGDGSGYLGVRLEDGPEGRGARVVTFREDSPAERAGLLEGDVIVGMDGREIRSPRDLTRRIRGASPGDEVELEVRSEGKTRTVLVELGEHPHHGGLFWDDFDFDLDHEGLQEHLQELGERLGEMEFHIPELDFDLPEIDIPHFSFQFEGRHRPRLGVQVIQPTPELREHLGGPDDAGVLVGKVLPGTAAEEADLRVGDLIVAVDGEAIEDAGDLVRAIEDRGGEAVTLEVIRGGRILSIDAFLPDDEEEEEPFNRPTRSREGPHRPAQRT